MEMNTYNSPIETLKRIKDRLEAGYFMLNDDIKWLLSEYEKQKEEKEMLIKQSEFKTRVAEAMEECKHENVEEKFKSV